MKTILDYKALSEWFHTLDRPVIVGIEGFTGAGKTHLADALARELGGSVVHTDDYVTGKGESLPYPNRLNYNLIRTDVGRAPSKKSLLIIEGICLREVLCRASLQAGLFVYVKRLAQNGLWHDGFHLENFETEVAVIENCHEPHRSDFAYHSERRPHERADIVFHRVQGFAQA